MTDDGDAPAPLAAVGGDTTRATAAFAALSDETRLAILLALWEAYSPAEPDAGLSFSELRERVGAPDSGQFNYHLGKLEGRYLRRTEDGYALRRAAQHLVRAVVAGVGVEDPVVDHAEIDAPCPLCGASTTVTYTEGRLYRSCTACEGAYAGRDEHPEGYLSGLEFDPAGALDRTPEEMWAAATTLARQKIATVLEGVCDECSGPVERSLLVCEDHDPDGGVCDACGWRFSALAYLGCTVCKNFHVVPPAGLVAHHPAVVAFYHDRGVDLQYAVGDVEAARRRKAAVATHDQELRSADPPRVRVTVERGDDRVRLTLDGELRVVDVER